MDGQVARDELIEALARLIARRRRDGVLRVAVDGPDAAGKTTLADELAPRIPAPATVIRAGIDSFHRPRAERLRRGGLSPEGCYHDTFDYDALRRQLLEPLGPNGDRRYRTAVFDHREDRPLDEPLRLAPPGSVLICDGVFLLRPQLRHHWDLRVLLDIDEDEIERRALERDASMMGGADVVRERYRRRYLPAQRLYRAEAAPERFADVLIDNNQPATPRVLAWPK
ncbi:AAA family ATPase [Stackebrandtia nassauensis]|uniref:Uridine kinase n=1 Tax=Stackebrandtia nassauensis (strain DSM 44728 / CIP 108903 / NRRL B-16338 / NBRC 102104 / LLR-40K-21) TaxID=446470 RepID=D3Q7B4_STANL|nr:AAA family ATPase [Stackebrandtia nassauensis]ADD42385.1 uridine kinase [Stackebrandtia nassauensis DSM 44728]